MSEHPDSRSASSESHPGEPADNAPRHRSVADGELLTHWSLKDFFSSLNTVMRLPAKARRKAAEEAASKAAKRLGLGSLENIRLPKGLVAASVVLLLGVFVVKPLVLSASGSGDTRDLSQAYGVWQANTGKYAGRMFEVGQHSIAFRTSSDSPDYTWHKIDQVKITGPADSALYTVVYEEEGKTAEFAFWFMNRDKPVIRFLHQPETVWNKTPYEPIARPKV
jgi:hypothetical protein